MGGSDTGPRSAGASEIPTSETPAPQDPLLDPIPDPWEDTETAHLRAFLKLTHTERFHLLVHAIEFMHKLRPPSPCANSPGLSPSASRDAGQ